MTETTLLIETTAGNTILGISNPVPVRISNKVYLTKRVVDLRLGDIVLYEKEFVDTSLPKIEPYLMESARYKYAMHVVFEQNANGTFVPRLRTELWRGITKDPNLEEKVLSVNGQDFGEKKYAQAIQIVYDGILGKAAPVKRKAVEKWLDGKTKAPSDKRTYKSLADINPSFYTWYVSFHPQGDSYHYYNLWKVIHQGIMRYLASRKSQGGMERKRKQTQYSISLTPEITPVLKNVIGEVNDRFDFARVTKITQVSRSDRVKSRDEDRPSIRLKQGVYHGNTLPSPDIKLKNLRALRIDSISLENLLIKCVRDYFAKKPREKPEATYPAILSDIDNIVLNALTGNHFYAEMIHTPDRQLGIARKLAQELIENIKTGEAERLLGIQYETLTETGDVLKLIHGNMPKILFTYSITKKKLDQVALGSISLSRKEIDREIREFKRCKKILRSRYGFRDVFDPEAYKFVMKLPQGDIVTLDQNSSPDALKSSDIIGALADYGLEGLAKYCDDMSINEYTMRLSNIFDLSQILRVRSFGIS